MPNKTSYPSNVIKSFAVAACLLTATALCVASPSRQKSKRARPPRVGTIKDYPATGLMTGCGNLYVEPANRDQASPDAYVFLSRSGGEDAWMNLDGRDVRLALVKSSPWYKAGDVTRSRLEYRARGARIIVVITPTPEEETYTLRMTITVRRGGAARTVKAVGSSDC